MTFTKYALPIIGNNDNKGESGYEEKNNVYFIVFVDGRYLFL